MAKAYWIVFYRSISDPAKLAAYAKLAGPTIQAAGGRLLVRGTPARTYEAGLKERVVAVEFDSIEQAVGVYESEPYKAALQALGDGAERDVRFLEGA